MTASLVRGGAVLVALLISGPAIAQAPPPSSEKKPNPDQVNCKKQEVIGSRLGTKRVCRTRAQWADIQLQERQEIEKI